MAEIIYNNKKYVQDRLPNWDEVSRLVDRAKGPNRTWKKFYEDCDKEISQATFTRITHKLYKKPLKFEMMQLIVGNAANPANVTMERMLNANGYVDETEVSKAHGASSARGNQEKLLSLASHRSSDIIEILIGEIEERGHGTAKFSKRFWEGGDVNRSSQFGFNVMEKKQCKIWHLYGIDNYDPKYRMFCIAEYDETIFSAHKSKDEILFSLINRYSAIFMQDAYEPEFSKDLMYSFVFINEETYKLFAEAMDKLKVNNSMSVIFVDPNERKVVEEKMVPRQDGKVLTSIFDK